MTWAQDPIHSHVAFGARHLGMAMVRGTFKTFTVDANVDEHDITRSSASVTIDAASIHTGIDAIDGHLKDARFLAVEEHPTITFKTTRITPTTVAGHLTIRGITREVELVAEMSGPIQDPWGKTRAGLTATGMIDRHDFGITSDFGIVVGNSIQLAIDLELIKQ